MKVCSMLHAAVSAPPGVMTTTLCANAQYMQVITTVEENAHNAPAWRQQVRAGCLRQQSPACWRSFNPALLKSRIDRTTTRPTGEG